MYLEQIMYLMIHFTNNRCTCMYGTCEQNLNSKFAVSDGESFIDKMSSQKYSNFSNKIMFSNK